MGSLTSPNRLPVPSQAREVRICLHLALHACPGTTIRRVQLPSCVTPLLAYCQSGSRGPHRSPKTAPLQALSIAGFGMVVLKRVV
jgi:hypothetical protein